MLFRSACYILGPTPATQEYPRVLYSGSHSAIVRGMHYDAKNPYDPSINLCPLVNNTAGSVAGYKYFNFSKTYRKSNLQLLVEYVPEGTAGVVEVFLDRPSEAEGGVRLGSFNVAARGKKQQVSLPVEALKYYNGKHALFFTFSSSQPGKSICTFNNFRFK